MLVYIKGMDHRERYSHYMILLKNYYVNRKEEDTDRLNDLILYMKKLNNLLYK